MTEPADERRPELRSASLSDNAACRSDGSFLPSGQPISVSIAEVQRLPTTSRLPSLSDWQRITSSLIGSPITSSTQMSCFGFRMRARSQLKKHCSRFSVLPAAPTMSAMSAAHFEALLEDVAARPTRRCRWRQAPSIGPPSTAITWPDT